MQYTAEILVVTLMYITPHRDANTLSKLQIITESLRATPGFVNQRIYHGSAQHKYYFLLTTWEDEDSWLKAREQYNPQQILQTLSGTLTAPPEQWIMQYSWGYNRPGTTSTRILLLLATSTTAVELHAPVRHGLRHYTLLSKLAFSFLAHNTHALLCFFSWENEQQQDAFLGSRHYQAVKRLLEDNTSIQVFALEAL